jgi:hypothetical protein
MELPSWQMPFTEGYLLSLQSFAIMKDEPIPQKTRMSRAALFQAILLAKALQETGVLVYNRQQITSKVRLHEKSRRCPRTNYEPLSSSL